MDVTWTVRRVSVQFGNGREAVACSDGSWSLNNDAMESKEHGREKGGITAAKRAALAAAKALGWL